MKWINQHLGMMPNPALILHIGAGMCRELPDYQQAHPGRIVLVEPNPEAVTELHAQAAAWDNVTVLPAAVCEQSGDAELRLFNFPELNSLHEPVGLYRLLPGLRQTGSAEVAALSSRQLIEELPLKPDTDNWLVLEAPGEELAILTALGACDSFKHFTRIIVRAGTEPFYDSESSSQAVLERLEHIGFYPEGPVDLTDADWPRYHLKFQPLAQACRNLQAGLEDLKRQLDIRSEDNAALKGQVETIKTEAADQAKQQSARIHQLEAQCAELKAAAEKRSGELESLRQANQELTEKLEAATKENHQKNSNLGVALRLQALRESDLQELQKRYGELKSVNKEQRELLGKLHQRLSIAADYLRLATDKQGKQQELPEELVRALSGKSE